MYKGIREFGCDLVLMLEVFKWNIDKMGASDWEIPFRILSRMFTRNFSSFLRNRETGSVELELLLLEKEKNMVKEKLTEGRTKARQCTIASPAPAPISLLNFRFT